MSASIVVVDDEPDVPELFCQRFRRESRQRTYVMHFAASGEAALELLSGEIDPGVIVNLSDRGWSACNCSARSKSASPSCW
jgi:CheY-like chemotaxis protein